METQHRIFTKKEELLADLLTPVGVYSNLRDRFKNPLLLESADFHDRSDSKSFICLEPLAGFESKGGYCEVEIGSDLAVFEFEDQKQVFAKFKSFFNAFEYDQPKDNITTAGFFGYSSFESVQYFEDLTFKSSTSGLKDNPDMKYQLFRFVLVFDHFKNTLTIVEHALDGQIDSNQSINDLKQFIYNSSNHPFSFETFGTESSGLDDAEFLAMVEKGVAHCQRGDVFQVVLSRSFKQGFRGDEFNVYRALRSLNPSPYLFYFDYGDFRIFGSSPEAQLQVNQNESTLNPIAGTIRRTGDTKKDAVLATQLLEDPKERSEHVMLVDLARNDLSKNCDHVEVSNFSEVQYFSHVIHLVSKVKGQFMSGTSPLDIYADTFPAGTLSGAPKFRAIQIIKEQEQENRNFYGGAIGFLGFDGTVNKAIIIRSVLSKNNQLIYQAGAGVVVDSKPSSELKEVHNKLAAVRSAIQKAGDL